MKMLVKDKKMHSQEGTQLITESANAMMNIRKPAHSFKMLMAKGRQTETLGRDGSHTFKASVFKAVHPSLSVIVLYSSLSTPLGLGTVY